MAGHGVNPDHQYVLTLVFSQRTDNVPDAGIAYCCHVNGQHPIRA
jgi:hypothetical protein